ncbi:hypothetical protein HOI26_03740 [Candidatus Woesearchaeota archaeon]|nr:hypothetical protein [Candidatus Woesearchaeota archaeon]
MDTQSIIITDKKQWRTWLRKNHKKEKKVNLISYKKHTGHPSLSHKESMEEAICFGWIDTTVKRLDEDKYQRTFVKRTSKGRWSNNTLSYAEKMIKQRKMTKTGMEMYQAGLKNGVIDHGFPRNPETPEDLKKALGENLNIFEALAPSTKRYNIYHILKAKRPETRNKRIKEIVKNILQPK